MRFRGGEFSTGTMGNFQPELTRGPWTQMDAPLPLPREFASGFPASNQARLETRP